jgi:hypothetical protein
MRHFLPSKWQTLTPLHSAPSGTSSKRKTIKEGTEKGGAPNKYEIEKVTSAYWNIFIYESFKLSFRKVEFKDVLEREFD